MLRLRLTVVELADEDDRLGVGTVRDERLVAVENVAVAAAARGRLHATERVGPRARLGDRPGADLVEREQVERPALLLADGALREDRLRREPDRDAERRHHAGTVAAELDDRDELHRGIVAVPLGA